tara:strand:- start:1416 stop:1976 length:561 start_codon:yes stop_codon:yes gene_type:complete
VHLSRKACAKTLDKSFDCSILTIDNHHRQEFCNMLSERSEIEHPIVRRDKEGLTLEILDGRLTFKVLSEETGGAYAMIEQVVPPGVGPPLHVHHRETEIFYVVAGTFDLQCGSEMHRLDAGSLFVGPRDIPHRFENVGDTPGRLLLTVYPGNFANFFREVAEIPTDDEQRMIDLLEKYDVELVDNE